MCRNGLTEGEKGRWLSAFNRVGVRESSEV